MQDHQPEQDPRQQEAEQIRPDIIGKVHDRRDDADDDGGDHDQRPKCAVLFKPFCLCGFIQS